MATERKLAGKKLPLTIAFTVLLVAVFGAGCKGFFQDPTLTSITIDGATSVNVGSNVSLTAYGVNSNGEGAILTSGVSWSSSDPTIAQITGSCASQTCGGVSVLGVSSGQVTITAGDESVTNTATLNVVLEGVTNFEVCEGTFGDTSTCSSGSSPLKWTVSGTNGGEQTFVAQGTSNGTPYDLTTQATWNVTQSPAQGSIDCTNDGSSPETCTVGNNTTTGTYPVTITYGTNPVVTATLDIVVD
ncbi:MAG: Ig-like domain-containing protein [Terriglobales bacterium]